MSNNRLPQELLALIHHIQLNEAGWWDKAIQRLIIAALWVAKEPLTLSQIFSELRRITGVNLDYDKARQQAEQMLSVEDLICIDGQKYKISEKCLSVISQELKRAENLEDEVKKIFLQQLQIFCPPVENEETWKQFNESFLLPLIKSLGANTYHLVTGGNFELDPSAFDKFTLLFKPELHLPLKRAVINFLDSKNVSIRAYVLRYLNAYFFIEAGSLDEAKIEKLTSSIESKTSFNIFVDTNFLFSFLGIHENPSNEAAQSLKMLIEHLKGKISVKLFVLPNTISEAKSVIGATYDEVKSLRLPLNLANAASKTILNGIALKFFQENVKKTINADNYFQPYLKDLVAIVKGRGIAIHDEINIEEYAIRQDVIDATMGQIEYEKREAEKRKIQGKKAKRPKTYHQQEHDMILWHFIKDNRPVLLESPIKAGYWAVSVDYRLLAFDAFKRRNSSIQVPICIHPTSLIQMLQFWIPRTTEFEETLLNSMKLPFLFEEFDSEAEKITLRILEIIGRYEGVENLPAETVSEILVSDALRSRIKNEPQLEKQIELVKEELIRIHSETKGDLEKITNEKKALEIQHTEKEKIIADLLGKIDSKTTEASETAKKLESTILDLEGERRERGTLQSQLNDLANKLDRKDIEDIKFKFVLKSTAQYVCCILIGLLISGAASLVQELQFIKILPVVLILVSIVYIAYLDYIGKNHEIIKNSPFFNRFHKFKWGLFTILSLIWLFLAGILINNLSSRIDLITTLKNHIFVK